MIALDLSRLLSRAGFATPTGIDRVELAYARHFLTRGAEHCFVAIDAVGKIGALPRADATRFIEMLGTMWSDGAVPEAAHKIRVLARCLHRAALFGDAGELRTRLRGDANPVYLLVSHGHLHRPRGIARLKRASGAHFVCVIHDLIPLDYPQYSSRAQTARHRRRIDTVTALADAVIVNSAATREALTQRMARDIPIAIAPLGLDLPVERPQTVGPPYFVCLGTIEPRKNHALLFDIWSRLIAQHGERAPRLLLAGRRGWGSAQVVNRLTAMRPFVEEQAGLPDAALAPLLRGARAMLLPSFAEGFGLPVIEALAQGVPVLCSDLPALRESGSGVPDYLDPSDAAAWLAAILDYTDDSPRRRTQLARLAQWCAPRWDDHFAIVDELLAGLR
jgi:glycosyltransferase involved in cell wall biosynthesis